jgi:hypothetical protein
MGFVQLPQQTPGRLGKKSAASEDHLAIGKTDGDLIDELLALL